MSAKPEPRLPIVGDIVRSKGRLVEIVTPPPIQPPQEYIFEDVSYEIVIMNGESMIARGPKFNNLYSDSSESALGEAQRAAKDKKWNIPQSGMRVEVIEIIERTCYVVNQTYLRSYESGEFYDREIMPMAYHKNRSCGLGEPTRRVIWSSTDWDANPEPNPKYSWWNEPRFQKTALYKDAK